MQNDSRLLRCGGALALLLGGGLMPLSAQEGDSAFELSVASIMRGPELVGTPPTDVRWTDDGRWVCFRWKPGGEPWHVEAALWRVPSGGGAPERLEGARADSLEVLVQDGDVSPDERWRVVAHEGDLYLIDRASLAVTRLTATAAREDAPTFAEDGSILFVREDNVYRLSRSDGALEQLTDIRTGPAPAEEEPEGQRGFLTRQQEELFERLRIEAEREEEEKAREEAARMRPEIHLAEEERVSGIHVEPGARWAVIQIGRPAGDARATIVPDYVTSSGYTEPLEVRAKVGDVQAATRFGLLDLESGEISWLDLSPGLGFATDTATRAPRRLEARGGDPTRTVSDTIAEDFPDLADGAFLGWTQDGSRALLASVGFDFKDQWLHALDAATGELTLLAHDHDDAWIGGPCSPWLDRSCAGWLPDERSVFFISERTGFAHLYTVPATGGPARALTEGEYEVFSAEVSPDEQRFHLHTSRGSPSEFHLDHLPLAGGEPVRVTFEPGRHDAQVSPDGQRLAVVHSKANQPPELFLMGNGTGSEMDRVTRSPTEEWSTFGWIHPEIVRFTARDGVEVPARIYRPADLGAAANGAAVIFVHGAGYLHNVHDWWSSYYREYMFHHLLASKGYTVLDIDYRGSAGYGRDWRTAIYRHMGGKDLSDQVDGARWLAANEGIDPGRVGIYGGSYGGFITLMALFTEAESFAAGAALRSVTDWAHYNHWYTGRILNLPHGDQEAYRRSSPIYFAEGLEDPLLIAHGMVDVNVHFQDVVRLAQRLIELGKTDWEMAVYPVEDHGFEAPSSWTDEYRRILELFERHLGGPAAAAREAGG